MTTLPRLAVSLQHVTGAHRDTARCALLVSTATLSENFLLWLVTLDRVYPHVSTIRPCPDGEVQTGADLLHFTMILCT